MLYLLSIVTIQSFITALLIYLNKKFKEEDFFLSLFFASFFIHLIYKIVLVFIFNNHVIFEKLHSCFSLLYGPLLFFYTLAVLKKNSKRQTFLHLTPFFIGLIFNVLIFWVLLSNKDVSDISEIYDIATMSFFIPSLSLYSIHCLILIHNTEDIPDKITAYKFNIVKAISYSLILISIFIVVGLIYSTSQLNNPINMRYIYYGLLLFLFFSVIHFRFGLFFETQKALKADIKYKNYELDLSELDQVIQQIEEYFRRKSTYLDSEFNLDLLSSDVKISKIKITQALNMRLSTNFYQYLNTLRVEESKKRIKKTSNPNFSTIGYESGFKNKSTFYKYFKQITGVTPSEYRKGTLIH